MLWDPRHLVWPQGWWPRGQDLGWQDPGSRRAVSPSSCSLLGEGGKGLKWPSHASLGGERKNLPW